MFAFYWKGLLLVIACRSVVYELDVIIPESLLFFLDVYFAWVSQMMSFWIDDVGVSLNGICINVRDVCLSCCH